MDGAIALGWINTVAIGAVGVLGIRRLTQYRFFSTFALSVCLLMTLNKLPGFYNPSNYLFIVVFSYVICCIAIAEVWYREFSRFPYWLFLSLAGLVLPWFIPMDLPLRYQFVREALVLTQLALLVAGRRNPLLLGWGLYGGLVILSDITKLFFPALTWPLLRIFDPLAGTAMYAVWLWHLLAPERERLLAPILAGRWTLKHHGFAREQSELREQK